MPPLDLDKAIIFPMQIGIAVAMSDEDYCDLENEVIKNWIKEKDERHDYRKAYSEEMRNAFSLANSKKLKITEVCGRIVETNETTIMYDALDLAIEVMAADYIIHPEEVKLIHQIVDLLEIEPYEANRITHKQILNMKKVPISIDIEGFLKIDPTTSNKKAVSLLSKEWYKWNDAIVDASNEKKRNVAIKMASLVSDIRAIYA